MNSIKHEEQRRSWFDRLRRTLPGNTTGKDNGNDNGNDASKESDRDMGKDAGKDTVLPPEPAAEQGAALEPRAADAMLDAQASTEAAADPTQDERAAEALLVAQAKQDPAAFGVLYERYIDRIYSYIYHRVGSAQDAEDLTARTFYRALDKLDTYEDRGLPFSAWLFRIAHNLMANWHRDRSKRSFLSLDRLWFYGNSRHSPEAVLEEEEKQAALWSAIERLPEDRKSLLLLKFGSQLSNLEIGELMDKSESAIKSLYFRTLATLREDLEKRGWGKEMMRRPEIVDTPTAEPDRAALRSRESGEVYAPEAVAFAETEGAK
ncbi:MAG: sigma-70 family RNA polymerase sigma factor [Litorilinea sp.]